ncbi:ABC-2 type transport system ATP-binding protein [Enterococcus sp. PF1-24]|uniref:ABC transporter ATP-binding protein n=1 Tax=unclassified Enterococcus TaxID=2608891 RepID=UPI002476521E|nr:MULTISPECIES: ABC transporter ATP-binding protein [unclassified Enterococcus]MDH6364168.1 ABC-2 type transport system ATP-binding protein [Enterococcus sp. PFB1-1]MDH6401269.1 ABC-2 type transport system ATP-binding protein [Enterococcus sp. PF1-24]
MKVIEIKQLSKAFKEKQVLKNISFSVEQGRVVGLLGPNGAGKSTLIECILGIKKIDSGTNLIFGKVPQKNRKQIFQRVGVQLQAANFQNNIKVYEICEEMSALYANPQDYQQLLKQFGLQEQSKQFVSGLSGGQKQKLSLVIALLANPEIVFLDELTTGLDVEARREVWQLLKELKQQGLTIFLTSHYMEEVLELCDDLLILKEGNLIAQHPLNELKENLDAQALEDYYLSMVGGTK